MLELGKGAQPYQGKQPCWNCKNFAGGCSWSKRFEPVEGWQAKKVRRKGGGKYMGFYETYAIEFCPEFEHD